MRLLDSDESPFEVLQVNASVSFGKGTTRGMHFLMGSHSEQKIVSVIHGKIQDVVVCVDANSEFFGEVHSYILEPNDKSLYIPEKYAHGFQVLSEFAIVSYSVDKKYLKLADAGINPFSPMLKNTWLLPIGLISDKDKNLPNFPNQNWIKKCQCC
jgi:dTDP-4-dehydrorhamnose 3,5-epimerase